jgi:hypothetical protein
MADKPKTIPAFELQKYEEFEYDGERYEALADPSGEFATYLRVRRDRDDAEMEIYMPSGTRVTVWDED